MLKTSCNFNVALIKPGFQYSLGIGMVIAKRYYLMNLPFKGVNE
jgi:hypothetical protein